MERSEGIVAGSPEERKIYAIKLICIPRNSSRLLLSRSHQFGESFSTFAPPASFSFSHAAGGRSDLDLTSACSRLALCSSLEP